MHVLDYTKEERELGARSLNGVAPQREDVSRDPSSAIGSVGGLEEVTLLKGTKVLRCNFKSDKKLLGAPPNTNNYISHTE